MTSKPRKRGSSGGRWLVLAPWGLGAALACTTLLLVQLIRNQEEQELTAVTRVTGQRIRQQFEVWFNERKSVLMHVASRFTQGVEEAEYREEVRTFLTWFPGFQAMSWVDAEGVVRLVEPLAGNQGAVGFDLFTHVNPTVPQAVQRAIQLGLPTRSSIAEFKKGGLGFGTYVPILDEDHKVLGFINGVFQVEHAFKVCLGIEELTPDFSVRFMERGIPVYSSGESSDATQAQEWRVTLFDRPVVLSLMPSPSLKARTHGSGSRLILTIGLLASGLGGLALHFLISRRQQRQLAEERRQRLERELNKSRKIESIGRLAGGVAHDFNNYLTAILGCGELLLKGLRPGDLNRAYAELSVQAGVKAARVTRQLLTFARRREGEPRVVLLNTLIWESKELFAQALGDDVEIQFQLDPELKNVRLDPGQFDRVLLNLVLNARDAMPEGGLLQISSTNLEGPATARLEEELSGPAGCVAIEIQDNGVGIAEEALQMVFEPFYSTKEISHGTGLGLSTCYGIIKQAGGQIEIDSQLGSGTTFTIYLPACGQESPQQQLPEEHVRIPPFRGGRVLLVEDEPLVRAVTESELVMAGYEVHAAKDGQMALELAERLGWEFDLLLSDWGMPQMGGRELANRLKGKVPGLPVLFVSGLTDVVCEEGESFLAKPFKLDELLAAVAHGLEQRARQP